jgi:NAD(P)-dependent dehydrogenase (short-subunit alcohol dehydrogenase family)
MTPPADASDPRRTILIVGASRGLGLALAEAYLTQGAHVVATVRPGAEAKLHALRAQHPDTLTIETVDINVPEQIAALRSRLTGMAFDLLLLNAGVMNDDVPIADVSTDEFVRVMVTNALSPLRAIESLGDLVAANGTIAAMSSGLGSVANNDRGGAEVYRASKAALNTLMRSYAARHADDGCSLVLLAPGWIRTDMGGSSAPYSIEESIPLLVATLDAQRGKRGLHYVNREGSTVPW